MQALLSNHILTGCAVAWAVAQVSKLLIVLFYERRFALRHLVSSGGMPSAHSAAVVALATGVGIQNGLSSPLFAVAFIFAVVVMYDAAGVRAAVSVQARLLNRMLEEMIEAQHFNEHRLRELIGHTPFEVFVGGLLGALTAVSWH